MTYYILGFGVLTLLSALRILMGPSIWDRLLSLNLVTTKLVILIILFASIKKLPYLLDIALVYVLLSFTGTLFISVYVQRKGRL
ncbi:MAG: pH regulation protein F [Firmicutes bacterium]|nr:pH regulation protein F [Bacillota bacterium]